MDKVILLLTGYSGAGKDTVGDYLTSNYNFKRYAFADVLKKRFSLKYNLPTYLLASQSGKKEIVNINNTNKSIREHLIDYAQYKRSKDPDIWANLLLYQIQFNNPKLVCITDWRQLNELTVLKNNLPNYKIYTIKIINNNTTPNFTDDFLDSYKTDFIIHNNGTIQKLHKDIEKIISAF